LRQDEEEDERARFFFPFGYSQTLYQRLHTLKQEGKYVNDYTDEFYQLVPRNDLEEIDE